MVTQVTMFFWSSYDLFEHNSCQNNYLSSKTLIAQVMSDRLIKIQSVRKYSTT